MIRTQITISQEQAAELRRLSARRRQSQASLMREAIDFLVDRDAKAQRISRARAVAGSHKSRFTDTAERHDEALDGAFDA